MGAEIYPLPGTTALDDEVDYAWLKPSNSFSEEHSVDFISLLVSKLRTSYLLFTYSFKNISYLVAVAGAQTNTQVEKTTEMFCGKEGWM